MRNRPKYSLIAVILAMAISFLISDKCHAVDVTPPTDPAFVYDGLGVSDASMTYSLTTLTANWGAASDTESGIARYWFAIGTTQGATDTMDWTDNGTDTFALVTSLSLTQSMSYYFSIKAENGDGLVSNAVNSNGAYLMYDSSPPDSNTLYVTDGTMETDIDFSTSTISMSANWATPYEPESGILTYWHAIGTTAGATDVVDWTDGGATPTMTVSGLSLSEGVTYYFSVKAQNLSEVYSGVASSDGQTIDTVAPVMSPPIETDGVTATDIDFTNNPMLQYLYGEWATATEATSGVAMYEYSVGSMPGATDAINWTQNGTSTYMMGYIPGGINEGVYFTNVVAMDFAGLKSDVMISDGIIVDFTAPDIINNTTPDTTWYSVDPMLTYDVDFMDALSGVEYADYVVHDMPYQSGNLVATNTIIGFFGGAATMTTDWAIDFATLSEGMNYVSVNAYDMAGNATSTVDAFVVYKDTVPPASGTIAYPSGFFASGSFTFSFYGGSDASSGIASQTFYRQEAPMEVGLCDIYGGWGTLPATGGASTVEDTNVMPGMCYQYKMQETDNAGNFTDYCTDGTSCIAPNEAKLSSFYPALNCQTYGDLSQNGLVNLVDLAIFQRNFGNTGTMPCLDGDFNQDNTVDVSDLAVLTSSLHTTASFGTMYYAPEPPSFIKTTTAALGLFPSAPAIQAGDMLLVDVVLDPAVDTFYGVDVHLSFSTDVLSISGVTGVLSEVYNTFDPASGTISFTSFDPSGLAVTGPTIIGTIAFSVLQNATASIVFDYDPDGDRYTAGLAAGTIKGTPTPLYVDMPSLSIDIGPDTTPPTDIAYVYDGMSMDMDFTTDMIMVAANWADSTDPETGVLDYMVAVGTTAGASDTLDWTSASGMVYFATSAVSLSPGITYYTSVIPINGMGVLGTMVSSDGFQIDLTGPTAVTVSDGLSADIDTSTSTTMISANWTAATDAGAGLGTYYYSVGTTAGATNTIAWTTSGSPTTRNFTASALLAEGQTYYVNVKSVDVLGNESSVASSDGFIVSSTPPSSAVTSPANGAQLKTVTGISGTASDSSGLGISSVAISISRTSDSLYWDTTAQTWGATQKWMTAVGTASWTVTTGLPAWATGITYTIKSMATGTYGTVETPGAGITFIYDTTAPMLQISNPVSGSVTKTASAMVVGATENGATVTINSAPVTVTSGSFSTSITLTEGANSIVGVATDLAGNQTTTTVTVTLDTMAPTAQITAPTSGASVSGSVTVTGTASDSNFQSYMLEYGYGASPTSWSTITSASTQVSAGTLGTFPASYLSGAYTLKLTVNDTAGNSSTTSTPVTVQNTVSFATSVAGGSWALVSLPMTPDSTTISRLTTASDIYVWWWDPNGTDDPVYGKYIPPTTLMAGQGLWINPVGSSGDVALELTGTVVDSGASAQYDYAISPGWNMIGTPFNTQTAWGSLYVSNGSTPMTITEAATAGLIENTPFYYDGSGWRQLAVAQSGTMKPGEGYFLYSPSSSTNISLKYGTPMGAGVIAPRIIKSQPLIEFSISAKTNSAKDMDNLVSMYPTSTDDYDSEDLREPPGAMGKYVSLYFQHDSWGRNSGRYANDSRSATGADPNCSDAAAKLCKRWDLAVATNDSGNVELSWPDLSMYANSYSIVLKDAATGATTDMTSQTGIAYAGAKRNFTVEVSRRTPAARTLSRSIRKGWNLIAIPADPAVTDAIQHLSDDLASLNIYQFSNGALISPNDPSGVDIQSGVGYWLYSDGDTAIDIEGIPTDPVIPVAVPLEMGWNLLGNPFGESINWGNNIKLNCGGATMTLGAAIAQGAISKDIFTTDAAGNYVKLEPGAAIQPWSGFFVNSFETSCSITFLK